MSLQPRTLWITYAWVDDAHGDFTYLVRVLETVGVRSTYDKIALVPGQHLWAQIGRHITGSSLDGWAYLLTPASLASTACKEELELALNRALSVKGSGFPLIGLLHNVNITDVPPSLRVRLCVNLASPDWPQQVRAALDGVAPPPAPTSVTRFVWSVRDWPQGGGQAKVIEVRPRFDELLFWRFAFPRSSTLDSYGYGPSGGGGFSEPMDNVLDGTVEINGMDMRFVGSGDRLTAGTSAYFIFNSDLPPTVCFGVASEPSGFPDEWEMVQL